MGIQDELSACDRDLSIFPARAFDFKTAGTVVIEQDVADVGSVVWDAEIILAYYLDIAYGFKLRGRRVLELGAGTGLAGIVAARLGANVVLTDQAKILPTLIRNARKNARALEWPTSGKRQEQSTQKSPSEQATTDLASACDRDKVLVNATHPSVDGCGKEKTAPSRSGRYLDKTQPDHTLSPAPDSASQNSDACLAVPKSGPVLGLLESEAEPGTRRHGQRTCNQADEDCGRSAPLGTWRVAELLFSENEEELMAFAAGLGAGRKQEEAWGWEDWGNGAREDGLFDLIIAADIIYLQSLWDAMAFTIKALLKPKGKALMSFEQRRSNVSGFFGPPRFRLDPREIPKPNRAVQVDDHGVDGEAREGGGRRRGGVIAEEMRIRQEFGTELGDAASLANVRIFSILSE